MQIEVIIAIFALIGALATPALTYAAARFQAKSTERMAEKTKEPAQTVQLGKLSINLAESYSRALEDCERDSKALRDEVNEWATKHAAVIGRLRRLSVRVQRYADKHEATHESLPQKCPGFEILQQALEETIKEIDAITGNGHGNGEMKQGPTTGERTKEDGKPE